MKSQHTERAKKKKRAGLFVAFEIFSKCKQAVNEWDECEKCASYLRRETLAEFLAEYVMCYCGVCVSLKAHVSTLSQLHYLSTHPHTWTTAQATITNPVTTSPLQRSSESLVQFDFWLHYGHTFRSPGSKSCACLTWDLTVCYISIRSWKSEIGMTSHSSWVCSNSSWNASSCQVRDR